jgi:hypothetical protein
VKDLAILVPTRGRAYNVARLIEACASTCKSEYDLWFAYDDDDPTPRPAEGLAGWIHGPRQGVVAWTNELWRINRPFYRAFASIGDDHVPMTPGWDTLMLGVVGGGGFAWCDNGHGNALAEACVMSASIPAALGWMCEPTLEHYFCDTIWTDLGTAAGCLTYLPDVLIEHRHWAFGLGAHDATYYDEQEHTRRDGAAYVAWKTERMAADVAKIKAILGIRR